MATHGTDHDMVQRLLTCKDDAGSRRSTWLSGFISLAVTALFMVIGFLLFVHLSELAIDAPLAETAQDLSTTGKNGHYLLFYALASLPPGVVGLIVAGVLAAAMSSLSSAFNAMTATFISDFYRPLKPHVSSDTELKVSRLMTLIFGVSVAGIALLVADFYHKNPKTDLLGLALGSMTFFYGSLLGIFLVALFTKNRGSDSSNVFAAIISTVVVFYVARNGLVAWPWNIVCLLYTSDAADE